MNNIISEECACRSAQCSSVRQNDPNINFSVQSAYNDLSDAPVGERKPFIQEWKAKAQHHVKRAERLIGPSTTLLKRVQKAINKADATAPPGFRLKESRFGKIAQRIDCSLDIAKGMASGLPKQHFKNKVMPRFDDPNELAPVRPPSRIKKYKKKTRVQNMFTQSAEEIVTFINADEAPIVGETCGNNVFSATDGTTDTDISNFFARPVRIDSYTWLESQTYGSYIRNVNPWQQWANNPAVKSKLNNYSWFRGDLHLKFQMTASPFYYGMLRQIYRPLQNFKTENIAIDTGARSLILVSQRPHIDMVVGEHDSYDMILPFIYPANWVNIQYASSIANLGVLTTAIYAGLDSANGVSGTGIGITVYAWVENIELSGASVGLSMQSGEADEFGEGPVSSVASWVANAATYLEDIPVIGPFATATSIGAKAISAIASMFGFTNVPVISDSQPYRPEAMPKLASSEIGFPIERMSLDPKNELSVDPRIIGLNNGLDELSLQYLATRESYLTSAIWSTTNLVDDTLFYALVHPTLYANDNTTSNNALYMTPMAWIAKTFKDWRGSIVFRFQIIASKYHKGKLRISFDPTGYSTVNVGNQTATANIVHTAIVDIGETMNVEFHVPYQQALQFLTNRTDYTSANVKYASNTELTSFQYNPDYDNGYLTLRVMTPLTAPVVSSSVRVLVFVKAGNDIEFANPCPVDETYTYSMLTPQSAEMSIAPVEGVELGPTGGTADQQYLVHYGENIRSYRQLLHRFELNSVEWVDPPATLSAKDLAIFRKFFYKFPRSMGYASASTVSAVGTSSAGPFGYNFVSPGLLQWVSNAFLCYRGSINWTFNVQSSQQLSSIRVYKDNTGSLPAQVNTGIIVCDNPNRANDGIRLYTNSGLAASAATNQNTQSVINVQATNYSRYKFQSTSPLLANTGTAGDGSDLDAYVLEGSFQAPATTAAPACIHTYCATGPDFGLYFFLNVPTVWRYASNPAPYN